MNRKTIGEITREAERRFPVPEGEHPARTMEQRQKWMRATYGGMAALNDED